MSKIVTLLSWVIITLMLCLVSALMSSNFDNIFGYWVRVAWIEIIISVIILSTYFFVKNALKGNNKSVGYGIFVSKCYGLGLISIILCIKSYFFSSMNIQLIHLAIQIVIVSILLLTLLSVKSIEIISEHEYQHQQNILDIKSTYVTRLYDLANSVQYLTFNERLQYLSQYFESNIKSFNSQSQQKKLKHINDIVTKLETTPESVVERDIVELELLVKKFYI